MFVSKKTSIQSNWLTDLTLSFRGEGIPKWYASTLSRHPLAVRLFMTLQKGSIQKGSAFGRELAASQSFPMSEFSKKSVQKPPYKTFQQSCQTLQSKAYFFKIFVTDLNIKFFNYPAACKTSEYKDPSGFLTTVGRMPLHFTEGSPVDLLPDLTNYTGMRSWYPKDTTEGSQVSEPKGGSSLRALITAKLLKKGSIQKESALGSELTPKGGIQSSRTRCKPKLLEKQNLKGGLQAEQLRCYSYNRSKNETWKEYEMQSFKLEPNQLINYKADQALIKSVALGLKDNHKLIKTKGTQKNFIHQEADNWPIIESANSFYVGLPLFTLPRKVVSNRLSSYPLRRYSEKSKSTILQDFPNAKYTNKKNHLYKKNYQIIRPLLYLSRSEISLICKKLLIPVYPDKSNQCIKYSRNRIRKQLLPTLKLFYNPQIEQALFQFSEFLCKEQDFIYILFNAIPQNFLKIVKVKNTK